MKEHGEPWENKFDLPDSLQIDGTVRLDYTVHLLVFFLVESRPQIVLNVLPIAAVTRSCFQRADKKNRLLPH